MRPLLARLLALFRRRQLDDELSDEISAHLELSTAEHVARGLSVEDARRAAALRFGGTLQTARRIAIDRVSRFWTRCGRTCATR